MERRLEREMEMKRETLEKQNEELLMQMRREFEDRRATARKKYEEQVIMCCREVERRWEMGGEEREVRR